MTRLFPLLDSGVVDCRIVRREVLRKLTERNEWDPPLQFAMVDDGQDLDLTSFEILQRIARHITVAADDRQQVYNLCLPAEKIRQILRPGGKHETLSTNFRNSPPIARLASYFGVGFDGCPPGGGMLKPEYFVAASKDTEIRDLAATLTERRMLGQTCGVLVPTRRDVNILQKDLAVHGCEIEAGTDIMDANGDSELRPATIITYRAAKGLTFDCVFMPRLVRMTWKDTPTEMRKRMLLVGITRATRVVYLSTVREYEMHEGSILRAAAAAGHLRIRDSRRNRPYISDAEAPE